MTTLFSKTKKLSEGMLLLQHPKCVLPQLMRENDESEQGMRKMIADIKGFDAKWMFKSIPFILVFQLQSQLMSRMHPHTPHFLTG